MTIRDRVKTPNSARVKCVCAPDAGLARREVEKNMVVENTHKLRITRVEENVY